MRFGRGAALAGVAAWVGYGWGAQLALPFLAVRRGPPGRRQVALTFDDGPDPDATPALLRLLAARSLRATFFLVGERAARHPEVVRAMVSDGHEVGNHGWRHRNAWLQSPGTSVRELHEGARILRELTGRDVRLYRPPWGIVNLAVLRAVRAAGWTTVLWSIQPEGLRPRAPERQLRHCAARLHDGAIVDLHDAPGLPGAPGRLLDLMPRLLDLVQERGYAPAPVSTLLAADGAAMRSDPATAGR
jgi:peptidoglycan/xylan/chitin deacetylase (PgdA/CDA1 family)